MHFDLLSLISCSHEDTRFSSLLFCVQIARCLPLTRQHLMLLQLLTNNYKINCFLHLLLLLTLTGFDHLTNDYSSPGSNGYDFLLSSRYLTHPTGSSFHSPASVPFSFVVKVTACQSISVVCQMAHCCEVRTNRTCKHLVRYTQASTQGNMKEENHIFYLNVS